ncbi:MAG: type II secretion system protein [Planctomycetaceae bacterium]
MRKSHLLQPDRWTTPRRGFTLIELLVAITIFAILSAIVISAFSESDQDRASAGAQQLRSMLEGARSRAIHDEQIRGVRLILETPADATDNTTAANPQTRIVTSVVYIGSPAVYTGVIDVTQITPDGSTPPIWSVEEDTMVTSEWQTLLDRGFLQDAGVYRNARIRFPDLHDIWYTITDVDDGSGSVVLELAGEVIIPMGTMGGVAYELELAPPILPGSGPQAMPNGIAIDLDGSDLPQGWRVGNIETLTDPMAMATCSNAADDSFITQMDILFTRGDIAGAARRESCTSTSRTPPTSRTPAPEREAERHSDRHAEKHERLVSLFTRRPRHDVRSQSVRPARQGAYDLAITGEDAP